NYYSRDESERKYSMKECKNILRIYREKFKNSICNDAIIINNDDELEFVVKDIKKYIDPFLAKL
ncbi:1426_t:CDS:1, partial [Cetraspora pellucida]